MSLREKFKTLRQRIRYALNPSAEILDGIRARGSREVRVVDPTDDDLAAQLHEIAAYAKSPEGVAETKRRREKEDAEIDAYREKARQRMNDPQDAAVRRLLGAGWRLIHAERNACERGCHVAWAQPNGDGGLTIMGCAGHTNPGFYLGVAFPTQGVMLSETDKSDKWKSGGLT